MVLQKQSSNLFCVSEDIYIGHIPQEVSLLSSDTSSLPSITSQDIVPQHKNETPGCQPGVIDSPDDDEIGDVRTPILPRHLAKSSLNIGFTASTRMQDGYIKSYRALRSDSRFTSLTRKERELFLEILHLAVWKETEHWIKHRKIILQPGQFCTTERHLANHMNQNKHPDDSPYEKSFVMRTIKKLIFRGFLQKSEPRKTILTVTLPGIYEIYPPSSEPQHETNLNQKRTNKEELQEHKEHKNPPLTPPSSGEKNDNPLIRKKRKKVPKEPLVKKAERIFVTEKEHSQLQENRGNELPRVYEEASTWKIRHGVEDGNDYLLCRDWRLKINTPETKSYAPKVDRRPHDRDGKPFNNPLKGII